MAESVFSRIYSYREKEGKNQLENYLTEILTYSLQSDSKFFGDFLMLLKIEKCGDDVCINSQMQYDLFGRPDIEIFLGNTAILVECKVEAKEGRSQLDNYSKILCSEKSKYSNKYLVYLTKYYEWQELKNNPEVELITIRWFNVYNLINDNNNQITKEFKIFLKEKGMEAVKNFTVQDILAMKTIPETISKMDEVLDQFKPIFEKKFGGYSKDSSRSTHLAGSTYHNYVTLNYKGFEYWLLIGFFWAGEESEFPDVGLSFELPAKKIQGTEIFKIFDEELIIKNGWTKDDEGTYVYYSSLKSLSELMRNDDDDFVGTKKFIEEQLNTLSVIQQGFPELFIKLK
jgi:hypothetical protein